MKEIPWTGVDGGMVFASLSAPPVRVLQLGFPPTEEWLVCHLGVATT